MSAVGTERGGMDKHHGCSVQQDTGAALATERDFPAASYSSTVDVREEKVWICDALKANHYPGSFINCISQRKPSTSPLEEQHFQKNYCSPLC